MRGQLLKQMLYFLIFLSFVNNLLSRPIYHGVAVAKNTSYAWICEKESAYLYKSYNYGQTWQDLSSPTYRWLFDIFALDSLRVWFCGEAGYIYHSSDGGENWVAQNFGGSKFSTRIFFLDSLYGWAACGEAIILLTTNGGEEWQQIILPNPPFPARIVDFYGVDFLDSLNGYICAGRYPENDTFIKGQGYIAKTTNGGDSWHLLLKDTINDFFDIEFINENEGWAVGGNDRGFSPTILHTTDGGESWQAISNLSGFYLRAVDFVERKGWACGMYGTILHTEDGINWRPQSNPAESTLFDIEFSDSLNGIAVGTNFVVYTTNGGRNWYRSNVGIFEHIYPRRLEKSSYPFTLLHSLSSEKEFYSVEGKRVREFKRGIYFVVDKKKIYKLIKF